MNTATLKKGQEVTVYQHPLTKERPEGRAILLEYISTKPYNLFNSIERWKVRFIANDSICERNILV